VSRSGGGDDGGLWNAPSDHDADEGGSDGGDDGHDARGGHAEGDGVDCHDAGVSGDVRRSDGDRDDPRRKPAHRAAAQTPSLQPNLKKIAS